MAFTLQIGDGCPDFALPGVDGREHALRDYADARLLCVAFTCNHCPYVVGSEVRMIEYHHDYAGRGLAMVAVNSNEEHNHPTDGFHHMVERARERRFPFAYLRDETQQSALRFGALKTPHFFLFDATRKLRYTGRMDDSPRDPSKATTRELRDAADDLLAGREVRTPVTNPIGCNVKWRGKPEKWMPPEACDLV